MTAAALHKSELRSIAALKIKRDFLTDYCISFRRYARVSRKRHYSLPPNTDAHTYAHMNNECLVVSGACNYFHVTRELGEDDDDDGDV